jgi:hypothetical protein
MDNVFVNIITSYVKLLSIIIWLFFINLNYFTLHYLRLFMAIFKFIGYFWLFHLRLFLVILAYFTFGYF